MRNHATIRGAVIVLVALSAAYALTFIQPISNTLQDVMGVLSSDSNIELAWIAAAALVLAGHVLRAWRNTLLYSNAAKTTTRSQLGAFAVGQLCSAVLPLKLGEFVRADIIAQRYRISYSFTFALICLERLIDAVLLFVLALAFVGFYAPLAVIVVLLGFAVWVLWASPQWFQRLLAAVGSILDDRIEARLLFIFWSLEYGLKRTLRAKTLLPYTVLAIANWCIYIAAFSLFGHYATGTNLIESINGSVGAYVALTTAVTPAALGSYSSTLALFGLSDPTVYIFMWMAAILPVALLGLFFALFKLRDLPLLRPREENKDKTVVNKLSRNADISSDQLGFLKDYYSGKPLARKVALDEIDGGPVIERFLSGGGSGAVTFLSYDSAQTSVTKLVPLEKSDALRQQFKWLHDHENPMIVGVSGEFEDEETYSINVDYEASSIDCFDYVHTCTASERKALLDSITHTLDTEVWKPLDRLPKTDSHDAHERVENYLKKHIEDSLKKAVQSLPSLEPIINAETLVVNDDPCANISELLEKIRHSEDIMNDLCSFRLSQSIHGDLILDNIIWSPSKDHAVILDPVPNGNYFDGPVFDFGKLSQSLWVGYEFMLRDTTKAEVIDEGNGRIAVNFADKRSAAYEEMWRYVADELAPHYLTESERRTMYFIGATNFLRRMKHQAIQCPANAPAFYAAGILHLNRYMRFFDADE